jgi:pyruvate dehydrogenase E2 component (dihydrolipoamide acetyltransferase)
MLTFIIKALVIALKIHPSFNASLDDGELILKQYFHIGFAADTPNGLVVPVIRNADQKGLSALAAEAGELAALARTGKLKPADMQGGCITISSLGGIGFTPIINAPEVAILGAARAQIKPVWDGNAFQPRLIMPVSLSWDHRVIDGAQAARFLVTLTGLLTDFQQLLLW